MATSNNFLIVGDSFVAEDNSDHYEWAWWNRLAKDSKANNIINLAVTGASNFNIWHQLEYGYRNFEVRNLLVVLTAPNRIENINTPINETVSYNHFKNKDITSWAVHDRLAQGELTTDIADTYFDFSVAESKDRIIAESILYHAVRHNCVILPNLFTGFTKYHFNIIRSAVPRDYCDVETGPLDELEAGHMYKSKHVEFYDKHKDLLLAKLD